MCDDYLKQKSELVGLKADQDTPQSKRIAKTAQKLNALISTVRKGGFLDTFPALE
jgi:hypothetical protein